MTDRRHIFNIVFMIILLLGSVPSLAGYQAENWNIPKNLPTYHVERIIDGDTIEVHKLGKIRYIGVNTPELHHPRKGKEPFGPEAYLVNKRLVLGKKVQIELDVQERDKYGRILAYVYSGTTFINAYLMESGYAQVMTIPPNVKYADLFLKLQQGARQKNLGIWGQPQKLSIPQSGQFVGSIKSDKFHRPTCQWAKKIEKENQIWFKDKNQAIQQKYQACSVCKP